MSKVHAALAGCLLFAIFVVAGEMSPYEKALTQIVESFEKIGTTLKNISDEEAANNAKPDLRKAADTFLKVRAEAAKLQPPEKDEKLRLEKQFKPRLQDAMKKMFIEIQRVAVIPGGKEALKEIADVLKKDEKEEKKAKQ